MRVIRCAVVVAVFLSSTIGLAEGDREAKVKADKEQFDRRDDWIYNDLPRAYAEARRSGKPIMVVMRCVPCEECVKLDDDLIDNDPAVAAMMKKFVRLRLTSTNGLDLNTFQYDTDQSFAVFFLNANKTVYGRFGTRSHRTEWLTDVSVQGMARAMRAALRLHENYPANRLTLADKSNRATEFSTPEMFPNLRKKPASLSWQGRDFEKSVVKNCIHCHQISEARMEFYLSKRKPVPQKILYPYPHPKSVGLILDPDFEARVSEVVPDSPAATAGLKSGDDIESINGQPLISMADVQWILHQADPAGAVLNLKVARGTQRFASKLELPEGWRREEDTSWRTGHWILRRSMLGGMKIAAVDDADQKAGTAKMLVEYAGNWGPFGAAKRAGVQKGDYILAIDGQKEFERESQVFDYINENKERGAQVKLTLRRGDQNLTATYKVQ